MSFLVNDVFPAGVVLPYGGTTAPTGWLLCNTATPVAITSYPRLYAAIGNTYNGGATPGDGITTFNIPNLAGVFPRGAGSQTISSLTYTGVIGSRSNDTTKKNGLTATAASSSVTGTVGGSDGGHTHQIRHSVGNEGLFRGAYDLQATFSGTSDNSVVRKNNGGFGEYLTNTTGSGHGHSVVSGQLSAAAQSITVGAGDTETRPANLGINFIIKI